MSMIRLIKQLRYSCLSSARYAPLEADTKSLCNQMIFRSKNLGMK